MATSTTDLSVPSSSAWVEIAGDDNSEVSGFITLFSENPVLYRQGTSTPDESIRTGHLLQPSSDAVQFNLLAGERAYGRSLRFDSKLIVTLDG